MTSETRDMPEIDEDFCVAALYQFAAFDDAAARREPLLALCQAQEVKGLLLLAHEGINGTIAGREEAIAAVVDFIRSWPECADLEVKYSRAAANPFVRMNVNIKREIVTMGVEDIDPRLSVGRYVEPEDWNALISDPDVVLIDTRNDYEVALGTFRGAIDPETQSFREFPEWFAEKRDELVPEGQPKKVAMFCTGGIRCEKSTAYLKSQGIDEVYHLKGGILKYLEQVPPEQSLWDGECYVFDQRVSVKHGLEQGSYQLCFACRRPLSAADLSHEHYERGVSCAGCMAERSDAQRAAYRERQRQQDLAEARGQAHLGAAQGKGTRRG